jgi:hypothetical protein
VNRSGLHRGSSSDAASIYWNFPGFEIIPQLRTHVGRMAEAGDPVEKFAVALEQPGMISIAQTNSWFHECIEHQLEIESRTADHLEHLGGRGLLLQRLGKVLARLGQLRPRFGELPSACVEFLSSSARGSCSPPTPRDSPGVSGLIAVGGNQKQLVVVGGNCLKEGLDAIKAEKMQATVTQIPTDLGVRAADADAAQNTKV